ncbi:MAG: DUF6788 family protein [Burkholderiales bacterium]
MTAREIEHRIAALKRALSSLGPLRPGSISRQYNVCGSPHCRCKADPPQRHGPYYQLSYTHRRKSSSEFVRAQDLRAVQLQLDNHERLRALVDEWIGLGIQQARLARDARKSSTRTTKSRKSASRHTASGSK